MKKLINKTASNKPVALMRGKYVTRYATDKPLPAGLPAGGMAGRRIAAAGRAYEIIFHLKNCSIDISKYHLMQTRSIV